LESDPGKKEDNWSDYIDLNKDETNSQPQFATISHPPEKLDSKSVSSKDKKSEKYEVQVDDKSEDTEREASNLAL